MAYETITDLSNPFNKTGLSLEARALLRYVEDAKADMAAALVVTCTTDHPLKTASGNYSRHRQEGTDGEGLALDGRMRTRGTSTGMHLPWFNAFAKVESHLYELIYAFAPYNIKAGKRVAPYSVSDHKDHVHVSVNKGVFVQYPTVVDIPSAPVHPPTLEPFMADMSPEMFVRLAYRMVLRRPPSDNDVSAWAQAVRDQGQDAVWSFLETCPEGVVATDAERRHLGI